MKLTQIPWPGAQELDDFIEGHVAEGRAGQEAVQKIIGELYDAAARPSRASAFMSNAVEAIQKDAALDPKLDPLLLLFMTGFMVGAHWAKSKEGEQVQ